MCLAVPGQLESVTEEGPDAPMRMGTVSFDGLRRAVCLALVPEATIGDWVVVHAGVAIGVVDEERAAATIAVLRDGG
ncbi:MAG: HypC/HybG/HupF family hydrogenase formation chaperone [Alphaproteobacteria bacterium]|nr:HypC/HybG/HupF family hydrogenase formation chaperone [Alphaproteobacteria bacterium]